jgi:aminoglycoside phosphotransferase (APT) family kinase protein
MSEAIEELRAALAAVCARALASDVAVTSLRRLTAGANCETWSFDCASGDALHELILRRVPAGLQRTGDFGAIPIADEPPLLECAHTAGVPVARVLARLQPGDELGDGYLMSRIAGETLPQLLLREPRFDKARARLAHQCGSALARIHSIDTATVPRGVAQRGEREQLASLRAMLDRLDADSGVFELALRWLGERAPQCTRPTLVHGDFRNGNLVVGEQGLAGVLDWELAHIGNPHEDLGWLCVNSWRFGRADKPVGGFGAIGDLLASYAQGGGHPPRRAELDWWIVYGTLRWGVICLSMASIWRSGADRGIERAAIGRRVSECEIDLLHLLDAHDATGD